MQRGVAERREQGATSLALLADLTPRQRALSSRPIRREWTTSTAMIAANLRCSRPRTSPCSRAYKGSGLLGNDRLGRKTDQQTASESGSESLRKTTRWIAVRIASSPPALAISKRPSIQGRFLRSSGPRRASRRARLPRLPRSDDEIFGDEYLVLLDMGFQPSRVCRATRSRPRPQSQRSRHRRQSAAARRTRPGEVTRLDVPRRL